MQNKLILLIVLFLAGCATDGPVIQTVIQRVEVPVAIPCKATVPTRPEFSFENLTPEQDIYEKNKSMLSDRKLHLGYETEILTALETCIK